MFKLIEQFRFLLKGMPLKALLVLFLLMIGGAGLEVVGVGIILPFIALLNDETILTRSPKLMWIYQSVHPESFNNFLQYSILAMIAFFLLKNTYLYGSIIVQNRYLKNLNASLACRLFKSYLFSPYAQSINRNSAQQIRNLTIIGSVVQGFAYPALILITEMIVAIAVFTFVIWANPGPALFSGVVLLVAIGAFYFLTRRRLAKLGAIQNVYYERLMQTLQQGLGSAKETRILGREDFFYKEYERNLEAVLEASRIQGQLVQLPRFFIESTIISILLGTIAWLFHAGQSASTIVASASIFAIAAIRLMPGFARISAALNSIRFYSAGVDEIYGDLIHSESISLDNVERSKNIVPLKFQKELQAENICFRYDGSSVETLKNISISIKKGQLIGLAGQSGAGKTTLIDILLGLLVPSRGLIRADGIDIQSNLRGWQTQFGYIPQQIYLMDDSIRKNVGFGLEDAVIDDNKVWRALELAQLADFVRSLPEGLNSIVGERGAKLSGGQRQRIGIARSLYHEPEILVMDEATAALDNETERQFMEALLGLAGKKTIIFIAHRLTTLERCDIIFMLKNGEIIAQGNFQNLFGNPAPLSEKSSMKDLVS